MKKVPDYLFHATPLENIDHIQQHGFSYRIGRPTVTGSLIFALHYALVQGPKEKPNFFNNKWAIIGFDRQEQWNIRPGMTADIVVNPVAKTVHGNPVIWRNRDNQLGIYNEGVENVLQPLHHSIIIYPSPQLYEILSLLKKDIEDLYPVSFSKYSELIYMEMKKGCIYESHINILQKNIEKFLDTMIKYEIIRSIRHMLLELLEYHGYTIYKNNELMSYIVDKKGFIEKMDRLYTTIDKKFSYVDDRDYDEFNKYTYHIIQKLKEGNLYSMELLSLINQLENHSF